jgi:hypothetical protein
MRDSMSKRSKVYINTLPPWTTESVFEEAMLKKEPRETIEIVKSLLETGTNGPNLWMIFASMANSNVRLTIPDTIIKLPHLSLVYLYNDEKGFIRTKSNEK